MLVESLVELIINYYALFIVTYPQHKPNVIFRKKSIVNVRISLILKVETDIITSIGTSLVGRAVRLYVENFKTDIFIFILNAIICLTTYWPIILGSKVSSMILTMWDNRKKFKISNKSNYNSHTVKPVLFDLAMA